MKSIMKRKRTDQRTALLALAADKQSSVGACLSPEEMAIFIDKTCSPKKFESYRQHLGTCETCYREWLTVSQLTLKTSPALKKHGLFSFFNKPKSLAIAGSTLAAAASIAVFLNIHQSVLDVSQPSIQAPSEQIIEELRETEIQDEPLFSAPEKAKQKINQPARPEAKISTPPAPLKKEKPAAGKSNMTEGKKLRSRDEDSLEARARSEEMTVGAMMKQDDGRKDRNPLEIRRWQTEVETECHQSIFRKDAWQRVTENGRMIQRQFGNKDYEGKASKDIFLRTLHLTTSITEANWSSQCLLILHLLEEEEIKR